MTDEQPEIRYCSFRKGDGRPCRNRALRDQSRCWHHSFKVPGRPSKLTAELREQVVALVLEGNYLETAAQAVGINKTTLHRWLRRAADVEARALEHFDGDLDKDPIDLFELADPDDWAYLDFRHALKSAEAWAETELLRNAKSGTPGWQAPMTILERRHNQKWRRRLRAELDVTAEPGARLEVVTPDTDEKRRQVAGILADAGALDELDGDENTTEEDQDA